MSIQPCPQCGTTIPADAPGGTCPRCLITLGMNGQAEHGPSAASGGNQGPFALPEVEQLIGRFPNLEIEHLIGQGGMGAVYRAHQTNLDRTVALKILSPQLNADPAFAERFTREARTLARLTHPNIVTVFDFGQSEAIHYLVMEYVDGVNLRDAIESTRFEPAQALAIIGQICDALQYAHDQGVVHRDIKPENILVNANGRVKIADFGLAKLLGPAHNDFTLTQTRQVLGTLKYMAPEQIERPEQVDHRADLYSLGVVFYELLTGELPIGRFAVPSAKVEISKRLDNVVLKTLEKEPDRRYQHASEIKTAVEATETPQEAGLDQEHRAFRPPEPRPASTALPFKTDDLYGGMAKGYGIARICEPGTLEVEIEIQDCFGATKTPAKTISVPLEKLSSVNLKSGIFGDSISIQAETMTAVTNIPGAKRGMVKLYTSKSDALIARRFVDRIQQLLESGRAIDNRQHAISPTTPTKKAAGEDLTISPDERHALSEQLRWPTIGMGLTGLVHLGLASLLATILVRRAMQGTDRVDTILEQIREVLGQVLYIDTPPQMLWSILVSIGFAGLLFVVAWHLQQQRGYGVALVGCILLICTPIHPLAVITLPLGIWALMVIDGWPASRIFRGNYGNAAAGPEKSEATGFGILRWLLVAAVMFGLFAGGMGIILTAIAYRSKLSDDSDRGPKRNTAVVASAEVPDNDEPVAEEEMIVTEANSREAAVTLAKASKQPHQGGVSISLLAVAAAAVMVVIGLLFALAVVVRWLLRDRSTGY